ncbi:MAG TPA: hypothetical protein VHB70_02505 [Parafilimonas sp.]|nr:hypothetical protein [Parafilimonas sp.]
MDKKEIGIAIRKIKDIAFFVNETLFDNNISRQIRVDFANIYNLNTDTGLLNFGVRIIFRYKDAKVDDILVSSEVETHFQIADIKNHLTEDGQVELPQNVWVTFVSLAVTHARALLAKNLAGTVYQNFIVPIVDATALAKSFFPNLFEQNIENK